MRQAVPLEGKGRSRYAHAAMLSRLGQFVCRASERFVPDPWVFAIVLTLLAGVGGILLGQTPWVMLEAWGKGFWELLAFSMQMSLILVTGHALASSPPVKALLGKAAALPKTGAQAAALVAFAAAFLALLNWGLGLIAGALLARETMRECRRRGVAAHYPLLGAAGYAGLLVWHGGLSGSAPLSAATPGHFIEHDFGLIPLRETLFAPANLAASAAMLFFVPLLCYVLVPERPEAAGDDARLTEPPLPPPQVPRRGLAKLADSPLFSVLAVGAAALYLARSVHNGSFSLTLDMVNFLLLFSGMALHGTPANYMRAAEEAVKGLTGIVLQFPFYAGIMGMVRYGGLGEALASWSLSSSPDWLALRTFLSASVLNVFIPSGGGQWAVQGPVALAAAKAAGAEPGRMLMAVAYGDQLTNMLQPFWALPLLGVTKLEARDIMGYAFLFMLTGALVYGLALWFW
jgi:short-chain fatty acids transporter